MVRQTHHPEFIEGKLSSVRLTSTWFGFTHHKSLSTGRRIFGFLGGVSLVLRLAQDENGLPARSPASSGTEEGSHYFKNIGLRM